MTLDEAIKHCLEVAEEQEIIADRSNSGIDKMNCKSCAEDHKQLATWLTDYKNLKEENKVLISECDRLIKEKGELLKKVSGGDVLRICQLEERLQTELDNNQCLKIELKEAKNLLKIAVKDLKAIGEFTNHFDSYCSMFNHLANNCSNCPLNGVDEFGNCTWLHHNEAMKLIGDDINDQDN